MSASSSHRELVQCRITKYPFNNGVALSGTSASYPFLQGSRFYLERDWKDLRSQRQRLTPRKQHLLRHNRADALRISERLPQCALDLSRFKINKF